MNKEEFQKNRQILKMLSTDMFNQMHNMYDQLAVAEKRIEDARKEGYASGHRDAVIKCLKILAREKENENHQIREEDMPELQQSTQRPHR